MIRMIRFRKWWQTFNNRSNCCVWNKLRIWINSLDLSVQIEIFFSIKSNHLVRKAKKPKAVSLRIIHRQGTWIWTLSKCHDIHYISDLITQFKETTNKLTKQLLPSSFSSSFPCLDVNLCKTFIQQISLWCLNAGWRQFYKTNTLLCNYTNIIHSWKKILSPFFIEFLQCFKQFLTISRIVDTILSGVVGFLYLPIGTKDHGSGLKPSDFGIYWKGYRGQEESATTASLPTYDASCYLCPGNKRAQGKINPEYDHTFVFVNDYSAIKESQADYDPPHDDGGGLEILYKNYSFNVDRSFVTTPPSRVGHWEMLCHCLFAVSQFHISRFCPLGNRSCSKRLDSDIYGSYLPKIAPNSSVATKIPIFRDWQRCQFPTAKGPISIHANFWKQGHCHGLLKSPSAWSDLDKFKPSWRAKDWAWTTENVSARA